MRIPLDELPTKGRHVRFQADDVATSAVVGKALEGELAVLDVMLHVERASGHGAKVSVNGLATVRRPCDRCGQPVELTVTADEVLDYVPQPKDTLPGAEVELDEKDLDVGFFDGVAIETDDVLSEAFALLAPIRVICGDDACAVPTSLSSGTDDTSTGHPAFAALKKLL